LANTSGKPYKTFQSSPKSFLALRHPGFRAYFIGAALAMMADFIEHVISYWVIFEKFQSPALAGFAVIAHWLPFLLFSIHAGALADKYDPRRIIQLGMILFIFVSLGWGYFFVSDTLEMWHAVILLIIHGFAGVLWGPASLLFVHDIVGDKQLESGVRLTATSRTLGILLGPAVGGALLLMAGPAWGIFINALIYLPLLIWLWKAPYGHKYEQNKLGIESPKYSPSKKIIRGFSDIIKTFHDISGHRIIVTMILLAGVVSLLVGNAYQAQMPEFARALGANQASVLYSALLTASAAGALIAGILLEIRPILPLKARVAFSLAILWCGLMAGFALSTNFYLSLLLLFFAGFLDLSFNSMAQTLVQLNTPTDLRGRTIGLFSSSSLGLKTFSGISIGFGGSYFGVHASLFYSTIILVIIIFCLLIYSEIKKHTNIQ